MATRLKIGAFPYRMKPNTLIGLDAQELTSLVRDQGQPAYRANQLRNALYSQRVPSLESISILPQEFRQRLIADGYSVGLPRIERKFQSTDGTIRYLMLLDDGQSVETVWMPEGDDGETGDGSDAGWLDQKRSENSGKSWNRATICVSSQVGCAVACQFCMTALLGVKRNLTAGEIVGQVCVVLSDHSVSLQDSRINLVFMGMGEPFLNYDNFIKAVRLLVQNVGVAESRITVSTAGIVPRIYDLGIEAVRPKLAISLNAPNDELRTQLMPINRKWNIAALMEAAREFPLRNREKLTFEYVLLDQVNDSRENAREVVEVIRGLRAKVNLIALNPGPGISFQTPASARVAEFQSILISSGVPTFIRRPRGRDIYAACGQLKRTVELSNS